MDRLNLDRFKLVAAATTLAMFAGSAFANSGAHTGVKLYGQVNRILGHADDGRDRTTLFTDNAFLPTTLGVKGTVELNHCMSIGAKVDGQYVSDSSLLTNQRQTLSLRDKSVVVQNADTWMSFGRWGTVYLGQGNAATRGVMNMSYSKAGETVSSSEVANLAGGLSIHRKGQGEVNNGNPLVSEAFSNLNGVYGLDRTGLYRTVARIKYQTANWYGLNFAVSSGKVTTAINTKALFDSIESAAADRPTDALTRQYTDAALRYEQCFDDFMLGAAVGWAKYNRAGAIAEDTTIATRLNPGSGLATRGYRVWSGSVAAEHKGTGINVAVGYGNKRNRITTNLNNKNWFLQVGKHFCWSDWGKSHLVADYFKGKNTLLNRDSSKSYSIGLVQDINKAHSSLYVTLRSYKYDLRNGVPSVAVTTATGINSGSEFNAVKVAAVGVLFKFGEML